MRIGLRVINQFQVNQHVFVPGKFVPDEIVTELNTNDPSQLSNRLNNGYVKWEPIPEGAEPEKPVDIDALDKAGLIEYAAQVFPGVKLDQRTSLENLRQQVKAMLERYNLLAGKTAAAQAARSGESARSGGGSSSASSAKPAGKQPPAPPVAPETPAGGSSDQGGAAGDQGTGDGNAGTGGGSPPA